MTHGIEIKNQNGHVLLSSDVEPFCYWGKASYSSSDGGNTHSFTTNCPQYPLVFIYVPQGFSASVVKISGQANAWTISVITTTTSIELYVFNKASNISRNATWGLKLFNSSGVETYNSGKSPLAVRDAVQAFADSTYNFRSCSKPIFAHFPFAIKETQTYQYKSYRYNYTYQQCDPQQICNMNTYWRSELQCNIQQVCNYVSVTNYVCNYNYYTQSQECSFQTTSQWQCSSQQVCNWVQVPYQQLDCYWTTVCYMKMGTNTMTWTQVDWTVWRETLQPNSNSQFSTTWVSNSSGSYNTDIRNNYSDPMGWRDQSYYYTSNLVTGILTASSQSPYANSGINFQNYLCLISDGALYD